MTARILDGRRIAENLLDELKVRVDARVASGMARPGLAVVLVGGDPASAVYVRNKRRAAEKVGIEAFDYDLPAGTSEAQLLALIDELNALGLLYIHVVDHSAMGAPEVSPELKARLRAAFNGQYILSGGYDVARANADLDAQRGDLVAFGRPFISNPDLVAKLKSGQVLVAQPASASNGASGNTRARPSRRRRNRVLRIKSGRGRAVVMVGRLVRWRWGAAVVPVCILRPGAGAALAGNSIRPANDDRSNSFPLLGGAS